MTPFDTLWAGDLLDQAGLRPGGAGVDPRAIVSLGGAIAELDPADAPPATRRQPHRPAPGQRVRVRREFLEAVSDADDQIRDWLRDYGDSRLRRPHSPTSERCH